MFHAWAEISESHQDENSTPKSLLRMPDHSMLIMQKSQTATRPADSEEAPSKSMPEPTLEHPVVHPNIPTQKDTARKSADSQFFFSSAVFYSSLIYIYKALTSHT